MARVYLASCEGRAGLHRFVALKCIHPLRAKDSGFVDMFYDEARIASLLAHPNVCALLDFDVADGTYYLVMEHLIGKTLDRVRPRLAGPIGDLVGGLTEARRAALVARIIADACEGLHAAHELTDRDGEPLEVVHRDVSPQNLMLTFDGCIKVLDFGVATSADQHHQTRTGEVKGKFSYLQPEILEGLKADRRADVWGLGVVAWELLTGRRLFHRENDSATLQAVANAEIPPPSGMRSGIPVDYDAVILRALARDRDERYSTARAFSHALTTVITNQGQAVGLADLAELMSLLFPGTAPARRQFLETVSEVECTSIRRSTQAIEQITEPTSSSTTATRPPTQPALTEPSSVWSHSSWWDARASLGLMIGVAGLAVGVFALFGLASAGESGYRVDDRPLPAVTDHRSLPSPPAAIPASASQPAPRVECPEDTPAWSQAGRSADSEYYPVYGVETTAYEGECPSSP